MNERKWGWLYFWACGGVILIATAPAATAFLDANACATSGVAQVFGGAWGHADCAGNAPVCSGSNQCSVGSYQEAAGTWVSFCGCPGSDGTVVEPECCHMVLRSEGSGPFLPKAVGKCQVQLGTCDLGNTCGSISSGRAKDAKCTLEEVPIEQD